MEPLVSVVAPWVRPGTFCEEQSWCEEGRGSGDAILFIAPRRVNNGVISWGLLDRVLARCSSWHPIVATNNSMSLPAT